MSGAESEECFYNVRLRELVKYQVQLEKNISHVQGIVANQARHTNILLWW